MSYLSHFSEKTKQAKKEAKWNFDDLEKLSLLKVKDNHNHIWSENILDLRTNICIACGKVIVLKGGK